ncbi:MAG: ribose-phosphate diphosphokinase [Clostridia bacterium]|nr:ribose-phosphate diphosphokinase [Clostridia bacterium]
MKSDKLGIIIMEGAEELAEATIKHLLKFNKGLKRSDIVIDVVCPRFSSGEAKGLISRSVRGYDLYIVSDVFNYGVKYEMYGHVNWMSPDDHYQNLKRIVGTVIGLAKKVHVVMPMLYEGRQHRCTARESLDSAVFLRELEMLGVNSFLTFDAHDERVRNAVPFMGFDNISPARLMIEEFKKNEKKFEFSKDNLMIISPDEGAIRRCIRFATMLEVDLGIFYKRRDYSMVVNGKNPIIAHEFLGQNLDGKNAIIVDDIISSGGSILDIMNQLKDRGADKIYVFATFGIFTEGIEQIQEAYNKGMFEKIYITNLVYLPDEYKNLE